MGAYASANYGASLYGDQLEHPYRDSNDKLMWILQVDWQNQGSFGSLIEPQSIRSVRFFRGRKSRLNASGTAMEQPDSEIFVITLNDPNGRYNAFNTTSPLFLLLGRPVTKMRLLLVSSDNRQPSQPIFTGSLTDVTFDPVSQVATLAGHGLAAFWRGIASSPSQPFSAGAWDPIFVPNTSSPFPINYWQGRPGGLCLQECVRITAERSGWAGSLEFGSIGDGGIQPEYFILRGKNGWDTLREVAAGFMASLFFLRDGSLFVMDPSDRAGLHPALPITSAALSRFGLRRGSPFQALRNQVEVKVNPFSVPPFTQPTPSASYKTGWYAAGPIRVLPGQQIELDVTFGGGDGRCFQGNFARVPSDSPLEPDPIRVNSQADGNGVNMGAASGNGEGEFSLVSQVLGENEIGIIYAQYGNAQSRCRVRLKNWSTTHSAYFFDLRVLVIGLSRAGDALSISASDEVSVALNSPRRFILDSDLVQSAEMAQVLAAHALRLLANRSRAAVCGMVFSWQGFSLYQALQTFDLGCHLDLGEGEGDHFGLAGRHLLVGLEVETQSPDCQAGWATLWLQKALPLPVEAGGVSTQTAVNAASLSWQHTVSEPATVLLVQVAMRSYGQVSSVSYSGDPLTRIGFTALGYPTNGNYPRVEIWALSAVPVGSGTVSILLELNDYAQSAAINLTGVDEGQPFGEVCLSKSLTGEALLEAALRDGDLFLGCIGTEGTAVSGNNVLWSVSSDGNWRGSGASQVGDGPVALSWGGMSSGYAAMGVVVRARYP